MLPTANVVSLMLPHGRPALEIHSIAIWPPLERCHFSQAIGVAHLAPPVCLRSGLESPSAREGEADWRDWLLLLLLLLLGEKLLEWRSSGRWDNYPI